MEDAGGLEDHIAGIRQLAAVRPYMDVSRVGIYGHSGGGFASTHAILAYPDFYKVAVSSAGNHDQRGYLAAWGEQYQGLLEGDNYKNQANPGLAANLKGKLLLAHGDMDDNVHPSLTIQVVDALIKANKDFDLLILPNRNHGFTLDPYFKRRQWDYFVRNLLGAEPPQGYEIKMGKLTF
jgi:dipeptidyl aminopeptidase/acylaminoacyl peptidase